MTYLSTACFFQVDFYQAAKSLLKNKQNQAQKRVNAF